MTIFILGIPVFSGHLSGDDAHLIHWIFIGYEWDTNDWGNVEDLQEEYEDGDDGDITVVNISPELHESTKHFGEALMVLDI